MISNTIRATGNPTSTNGSYGIQYEMSPYSTILCNAIEKTGFAIQAVNNCDDGTVHNNRMKLCYYGFSLSNSGIVGPQGSMTYPSDNTWQNVTNSFWSFYSNGDDSPFFVRNSSILYNPPDPPSPGNTNGFAVTKVVGAQGSFRACIMMPLDPNPHLSKLQLIAQNQYPYYLNDSSEIFIGKKMLRKIIRYDSIIQNDPILASYYSNTVTQNIGLLDTVLFLMRTDEFNAALTLNELILPANNLEMNEQMVNRIELQHLISGADYTSAEIEDLRILALSCPFTEGTAVYHARNLLVIVDSFNTEYYNSCELSSDVNLKSTLFENITSNDSSPKFLLYPNPTSGTLTVSLINSIPENQYILEIFNMLGQCVRSITIPAGAQEYSVSLDNLENALYLYVIRDQYIELDHGKIVLFKP